MNGLVIFCSDPLDRHAVDPAYAAERDAAQAAGLDTALVDFEALLRDMPERAVRGIPHRDPPQLGMCRGVLLHGLQAQMAGPIFAGNCGIVLAGHWRVADARRLQARGLDVRGRDGEGGDHENGSECS